MPRTSLRDIRDGGSGSVLGCKVLGFRVLGFRVSGLRINSGLSACRVQVYGVAV